MNEDLLTTELNRRADGVVAPPLSFDDVRGRAHGIRRRRRAAAGTAVAAVVALVIVVPTLLAGAPTGSDGVDPAPAPPPTGQGASVLHDGTLTLPDGATVPLDVDNADVSQLGVLTDGRVVIASMKPYGIRVFAADGEPVTTYPADINAITMSPTGNLAAWTGEGGRVQVLESGSADPVSMPAARVPGGSPVVNAALGSGCGEGGCRVLVGDGTTTTAEVTVDGVRDLTTSEPLRVVDVSPGGTVWAVSFIPTAENEQFGCSGLYDPESDEVVARSCETSGLQFAPDGQHLLGMRGDNNMYGEVSTFDLDLQPVGTFAPDGRNAVVSRAGWADAAHLVVSVSDWQTSQWSLVRVGLDGSDPTVVVPDQPGRNPETIAEFIVSD